MKLVNKKILVTGGAGFIGSHIVDMLLKKGNRVTVLDDLSAGALSNVSGARKNHPDKFSFIKGSIMNLPLVKDAYRGMDAVFHHAAQPDVRKSFTQVFADFDANVRGTLNVLEAARENHVSLFVFASSAGTVYGENPVFPTPETCPFDPISHYGATKAACEMYLMSYSALFDMQCVSLRYGNIFGPRSNHGVIWDFYHKLKKNPRSLEILGDGMQNKSYMYIDDCVNASVLSAERAKRKFEPFNISTAESIVVKKIARWVVDAMKLKNVAFTFTGGKRGWEGDVVRMRADVKKLQKIGWKQKVDMKEGVSRYVRWLSQCAS